MNAFNELVIDELVIDDSSSISYKKSEISNESFYKPDLQELISMFNDNPDFLFSFDTSNCLTFILEDNSEISLHQYANQNIEFIKISNESLAASENDILISMEILTNLHDAVKSWINPEERMSLKYSTRLLFRPTAGDMANAEKDLGGYKNTVTAMTSNSPDKYPAMYHCYNYKLKCKYASNYKGYLMSAGQLKIIADCLEIIKYIMTYTYNDCTRFRMFYDLWKRNIFWSSTPVTNINGGVWTSNGISNITWRKDEEPAYVFPIFKKIN